jgi:hypothetical protein
MNTAFMFVPCRSRWFRQPCLKYVCQDGFARLVVIELCTYLLRIQLVWRLLGVFFSGLSQHAIQAKKLSYSDFKHHCVRY